MAILQTETKKTGDVVIESLYHDSSNILKTSYNYSTNDFRVTFKKGTVYSYNIPVKEYQGLKESESVGKYFNSNIKNKYTHKLVGDVPLELLTEMENKLIAWKNPDTTDGQPE